MKNYKRFSFIKGELEELLNVATLVVSRGGATALADFSKVGVPMLIIPLSTKSSRGDQIANAQRLSQNNAAVVLDSDSLDEKKFLDTVVQLLSCVKIQEQLAYNAAALYKGDAEKLCVDAILKTLKGRN
jgi:UDP-N-acetylglucosamine:LPS N-acetylglucosamine transferase